jgi:hypothetical protein
MKKTADRRRVRATVIAAVAILAVAAVALTANPIQSALSGYFIQKSPADLAFRQNIQTLIDTTGKEIRSERSDWFGGLTVAVDCAVYDQLAQKKPERYPLGFCLGKTEVLYTDYMVKELPAMPKDFFIYRQALFEDPLIKRIPYNPEQFDDRYWLQPEWVVPFEEQKVPVMKQYIEDPRYGPVWGVGTWDDKIVKVTKAAVENEDIVATIYAWIEPVPTTAGYLGVGLRKVYPSVIELPSGLPDYNNRFSQDPAISERYLDLKIEPDELLLEPNFPYFHPGYRRMITLTLTVKRDTPEGVYVVGMQPDAPSKQFSEEHRLQDPVNYWDPYGGFARIGSPYQVVVDVKVAS